MTYSKGRQNDIKTYCFNDIFAMRYINCELRLPFYLPLNYVIERICLYVIMSKKGYVILSGRGTSLYP